MSRTVRANRSRLVYLTTAAAIALLASAAQAQDAAPKTSDQAPAAAAGSSSTTVKEVVITGQRAAIRNAIQNKKNADVILDSVSADDAGKLPDNSVTEVLQRLPGVNITRIQTGAVGAENFLAEGTNLTIRGLDSTSTLNGRDAFSSVNGRGLAWEDISPELMSGVDVVKSSAAYLPEGALGGVVDLRTAQPFDFKDLTIRGSIGANYADYAGQAHPEGNVLLSDRWQTSIGEFGLLVNLAYSDLSTRADGVQVQPYFAQVYDPTLPTSALVTGNADGQRLPNLSDPGAKLVFEPYGVDFSQRLDDRTRTGIYVAGQWRPNDQLLIGLTVFDSQYQLNSFQHYLMVDDSSDSVVPAGATATFNSQGFLTSTNILQGYAYAQPGSALAGGSGGGSSNAWGYVNNPYDFQSVYQSGRNETRDISLTASWRPTDRFNLKLAYQHVDSSATESDHYAYDYAFLPPVGLTLSSFGSSALPKLAIPSSVDLTNSANFGYLATMDHLTNNQGTEDAVYADGAYQLGDGFFRSLRFGVKLALRNENDDQTPYNYQALSPYYDSPPYTYLNGAYPQYNQLVNIGSWFQGQMGLPAQAYFPSMTELMTNFGTLHQQLGTGVNATQGVVRFAPGDNSYVKENTETVYVMGSFKDDQHFLVPFNGNIGVRIVADDDKTSGALLLPASLGSYVTPVAYTASGPTSTQFTWPQTAVFSKGGHSGVYALPSLNIQFLPVQQMHVRFAASETIQRPSFSQINPQATLGGTYVGTYTQNWITSLQGDPDLKPERSTQLDASVEWYFKSGGQAHVAVFWKSISDYIGTRSGSGSFAIPATVSGGYLPPSSAPSGNGPSSLQPCPVSPVTVGEACPQTIAYTSQSYFNESTAATIQGVEVGLQKYADFLPKPWSGFGIDANYTYIDSRQPGAVAYDMLGNKINNLPVTGLSKNTVNFTVMYDNGPLSMRLAYNWRDDFLVTTSAYQTSGAYDNLTNVPDTTNSASVNQFGVPTYYALPVFSYPAATLDGNITYRLSSRITWDLQASNLTNTTYRLYMGAGDERANRSWYTADRRYITRIHFAF